VSMYELFIISVPPVCQSVIGMKQLKIHKISIEVFMSPPVAGWHEN